MSEKTVTFHTTTEENDAPDEDLPLSGDGGPVPTSELETAKILIVDDVEINREVIGAFLRSHGFHNLTFANDGRSALSRVLQGDIDLLVLDLAMPEMDGYAACEAIRANPAISSLPIIVQTMLDQPAQRSMAFDVGATDLVSKPINRTELIARVRIHLERQRLIADLSAYQQRVSQDLAVAREMQNALLPRQTLLDSIFQQTEVQVVGALQQCTELGGDMWGTRAIDSDRVAIYTVDFSGHGISSALNTFRLQSILDEHSQIADDPSRLLCAVNKSLCDMLTPPHFATMIYGVINKKAGQFDYAASASVSPATLNLIGHSATLSRSEQATTDIKEGTEWGDGSGLPLGISKSAFYETRRLTLTPGHMLLLVSDAFVETPVFNSAKTHMCDPTDKNGAVEDAPLDGNDAFLYLANAAVASISKNRPEGQGTAQDARGIVQHFPQSMLAQLKAASNAPLADDATIVAAMI